MSTATLDRPSTAAPRRITAPRGTELSCRGWQQEAAMRMLMNNLDPAVAERPEELVVYGGSGKAARDWRCFEAIVATAAPSSACRSTARPGRSERPCGPHGRAV